MTGDCRSGDLIEQFLDATWLESGLSANTLAAYRSDLSAFNKWCDKKIDALDKVSRADLLSYLAANVYAGLSARSSARRLSTLRRFYRYLLREGLIVVDPTLDIRSPAQGRPLPKAMTETAVEKLLGAPSEGTALSVRDRSMLETMYSSGLRVSELVKLNLSQLDLNTGLIRILGKGGKERIVPLGDEAADCLQHYLEIGRPELLGDHKSDGVFLTRRGHPMTRQAFW